MSKSKVKQKAKSAKPAKQAEKPSTKVRDKLTKSMTVFAALKRPDGATVDELAEVTGWQKHSVRGFLSIQKKKRADLAFEKFTRGDGKTAYKIDAAGDSGNG